MSDLIDDGTSPWGDQVSISNHNSSSSSLALGSPNAATDTDPILSATTILNHNDVDDDSKKDEGDEPAVKAMSQSTPALSSPRRASRAYRGRKGKLAKAVQVEEEDGDGPLGLGPLGGSSEAHGGDDDDDPQVTPKASKMTIDKRRHEEQDNDDDNNNGVMQDVPLNNNPNTSSTVDIEQGMNSLRLSKDEHDPAVNNTQKPASETFNITVGDPIKVGDITSAHTVYTVHTKTSSAEFAKSEVSVTRRYRDFRWVFHALEHNHPGYIIPPPPEKQAMGRFNEDFVEARRAALETMLNKIGSHPVLQHDEDYKLFLESEHFANESKHKAMNMDDSEIGSSAQSSSKGGFMSSIGGAFSFSNKYIETSDWFIDKKNYMDNLESQLKSLAKSLDMVVTQRRELGDATGELATVLESLSSVEISRSLTDLLANFSSAQQRIRDLYARQCMQDILSLATTLDEYIRLIGSIRSVFLQRQKTFLNVQTAEQELAKKRQNLDKLNRQGRTLQDKIAQVTREVEEQDKRVSDLRVVFDDISKTIMTEFDRFEHEKVRDFRNSVELFLENAIEAQKEAIEIWETFYRLAGFSQPPSSSTTSYPASQPVVPDNDHDIDNDHDNGQDQPQEPVAAS